MAKIDHHIHTSRYSPDSVIAPDVLVARARAVGLDGVVITEHDWQWDPDELADLAGRAEGLVVLSGVEVSTLEGHFLVYGLPDLDEVPVGIPLADLLEVVRGHEAAIVAAHPFRWDQDFRGIVAQHGPAFDALELVSNNVTPQTRRRTEELLQAQPMGATGSSDAHVPEAIGCYFTEFPDPISTMADFVAALRRQSGRPRHRAGAWQASGPVD
jgi:predicted metal-dependent phosphoesterase TrpH